MKSVTLRRLGFAYLWLMIIFGLAFVALSIINLMDLTSSKLLLRVLWVVVSVVYLGGWGFWWLVNELPWYQEFKKGWENTIALFVLLGFIFFVVGGIIWFFSNPVLFRFRE